MINEAQLLGFLPERCAGEDGQVENLHLAVKTAAVDVLDAAADGIDRVAGEADDQIDFDFDAQVEHRAGAALERAEIVVAVHQFHGQRIDRLQADFNFVEAGFVQELRRRSA